MDQISSLSPRLEHLQKLFATNKSLLIEGLWETPKALLAHLASLHKAVIIITSGQGENRLGADLPFFHSGKVFDFPSWETLPSESIAPSPDIVGMRLATLEQLCEAKAGTIVLCPLQAVLQKVMPKETLKALSLALHINQEIDRETLQGLLVEMGYKQESIVCDKGQFAMRGSIVDLFPIASPDPFRLEFLDNILLSIRAFDPMGQKSVRKVDKILLTAASEETALSTVTLFDYMPEKTMVFFDDILALEDRYVALSSLPGAKSPNFMTLSELMNRITPLQKVFFSQERATELDEMQIKSKISRFEHEVSFSVFGMTYDLTRIIHPFLSIAELCFQEEEPLPPTFPLATLAKLKELVIVAAEVGDELTFKKRLQDENVHITPRYARGYLSFGFGLQDHPLVLFPLTEITHRYQIKRQKLRSSYHVVTHEAVQLSPGDLVVHFHHGIGKYVGNETKLNHLGVTCDFLVLEYQDRAKLYVPMVQSYLVSKYVGASEEVPTLHELGGKRWQQTRAKAEKAVSEYAKELILLYAKRTHQPGYACLADSHEMHLFEGEFPYIETDDQLRAIADVKADMMAPKCMDRLVCGDVGYGKTEVAMRAAFKAVVDGETQVALLVPTTVLALQHFDNFKERMRNFPIRIAHLSRFSTSKETQKTLKELAEGSLDIVIGTHRVISKDVQFKRLGLVIVDEEQRFGVKAKEHLKRLTSQVDCLTLSATPIPRTLYMSLVGARDMSVIATPPQDRLPIKTIVTPGDDQVLQTALMRELTRDGQAFVIHNRVETLPLIHGRLAKIVPHARILTVHGQMSAEEVDEIFHAFKQGKADILLATTIVENGIDIPNANTILIDRSDRFGLADLYQLRGRVGRWNRPAYCYFLTPPGQPLSTQAHKRLQALVEACGFGGGMRIAMRDLELRGAGDLLGIEQSGHVATVGFHLYCKMLKKAIASLQHTKTSSTTETKLEFPQEARFPESYIPESSLRMELYTRLGEEESLEGIDTLFEEIKDRFGPLPQQALWLYHFGRVRLLASQKGITQIKLQSLSLTIEKGNEQKRTLSFSPPKDPKAFEEKLALLLPA